MAHEIDTTTRKSGSAMYANKPAWHGLGTVLDHAPTAEEAIVAAGLDWLVEKSQVTYDFNGQTLEMPGRYVMTRQDTGAPLGIVSDLYQPLQNAEAFDALSLVLQEKGLKYESAGSLFGGKTVWLLARHPDVATIGGDAVERYVLLATTHDGTGSIWIQETDVRVVCNNTLTLAKTQKDKVRVTIPHLPGMHDRLREAREAFARTEEKFESFKELGDSLRKAKVYDKAADAIIEKTLDHVLGEIPADKVGAAVLDAAIAKTANDPLARKLAKRADAKEKISGILRRELQDAGAKLLNGWLLSSALAEWADTSKWFTGSDDAKAEKRLLSLTDGDVAQTRAFIFETVAQVTGTAN